MCGFVVTVVVGGRSSQEVDFFFKYYARGAAVGEEFLLSSADKQVCWQLLRPEGSTVSPVREQMAEKN